MRIPHLLNLRKSWLRNIVKPESEWLSFIYKLYKIIHRNDMKKVYSFI